MMRCQQDIGAEQVTVFYQFVFAGDTDIGGKQEAARAVLEPKHQAAVVGGPGRIVFKKTIHTHADECQVVVVVEGVSHPCGLQKSPLLARCLQQHLIG